MTMLHFIGRLFVSPLVLLAFGFAVIPAVAPVAASREIAKGSQDMAAESARLTSEEHRERARL